MLHDKSAGGRPLETAMDICTLKLEYSKEKEEKYGGLGCVSVIDA